jgi:hypothetical protein
LGLIDPGPAQDVAWAALQRSISEPCNSIRQRSVAGAFVNRAGGSATRWHIADISGICPAFADPEQASTSKKDARPVVLPLL